MRFIPCAIAAAALFCTTALQGQQVPQAEAVAIATAPTIDGVLDEGFWAEAGVLADLVQREPMEGQPVSERTEVRMAYDDEALYVGAWMFDRDVSSIVFGQTLRDASLNDSDAFVLVLDTYLDRQNGFVFGTTPAGIEYDGQVSGEGRGWRARGRTTAAGLRGRLQSELGRKLGSRHLHGRARLVCRDAHSVHHAFVTGREGSRPGGSTSSAGFGVTTSSPSGRRSPASSTSTACRWPVRSISRRQRSAS